MSEQDMFGKPSESAKKPRPRASATKRSKFSWFFALRPAATDASRIYAAAQALLASKGILGTGITPDRLHITLEWIGDDVEEEVVNRACDAADTLRFPAVDACFTAAKTFPAPSGPCVLLGSEGLDAVRKLRGALVGAMADQGFKLPRAYEPHMTLCYDRVHRLAHTSIAPISFHTGEFALVKSHLGLSRHEVMRTWRLIHES